MYLAREHTRESLPAIGRKFGGRGHTTVLHACRRTEQRLAADPEASALVDEPVEGPPQAPRRPGRLTDFAGSGGAGCALPSRSVGAFVTAIDNYTAPTTSNPFSEGSPAMKIETSTAALLTDLQTVARVASTRSAIQALAGVQFVASETGVELRATDMEIGLRAPLEAQVVRPGEAVLPARLLLEVVRQLPGDSVTLELRPEQQDVELVAGTARFHLRTLRGDDFPVLPGARRRPRGRDAGAGVHRDDRPRLALGLAR